MEEEPITPEEEVSTPEEEEEKVEETPPEEEPKEQTMDKSRPPFSVFVGRLFDLRT